MIIRPSFCTFNAETAYNSEIISNFASVLTFKQQAYDDNDRTDTDQSSGMV